MASSRICPGDIVVVRASGFSLWASDADFDIVIESIGLKDTMLVLSIDDRNNAYVLLGCVVGFIGSTLIKKVF